MEHNPHSHHQVSDAEHNSHVSAVWRATLWLSIITVIEVVAAYMYPHSMPRMLLNVFFIAASSLKAYFIVAEFMHVRYEARALIITILAPTFFLIWFIIAFLWEGSAWLSMREFWGVIVEKVHGAAGAHH